MKKGRHRRYEEARALKRGSDLDIESIFSDLSDERAAVPPEVAGTASGSAATEADVEELVDDDRLDDELIEDELEQR